MNIFENQLRELLKNRTILSSESKRSELWESIEGELEKKVVKKRYWTLFFLLFGMLTVSGLWYTWQALPGDQSTVVGAHKINSNPNIVDQKNSPAYDLSTDINKNVSKHGLDKNPLLQENLELDIKTKKLRKEEELVETWVNSNDIQGNDLITGKILLNQRSLNLGYSDHPRRSTHNNEISNNKNNYIRKKLWSDQQYANNDNMGSDISSTVVNKDTSQKILLSNSIQSNIPIKRELKLIENRDLALVPSLGIQAVTPSSLMNFRLPVLKGRMTTEDNELLHNNWFVDFNLGVNWLNLKHIDSNVQLERLRAKSENSIIGGQASLMIGKNLTDALSLRTGLEYSQLYSEFKYSKTEPRNFLLENQLIEVIRDRQTGEIIEEVYGDTTVLGSVSINYTNYNQIRQISLPVYFGYSWNHSKLEIGLFGGPSLHYVTAQKGQLIDDEFNAPMINLDQYIQFTSDLNIGLHLGAELSYPISNILNIHLQPRWSYMTYKPEISSYSDQVNINIISLDLGLRMRL